MKISKTYPTISAELDTDICAPNSNAELTLTLRLGLRQQNPQNKAPGQNYGTVYDGNQPGQPVRAIVDWKPAEWAAFKQALVRQVESVWSKKFWLINGKSWFQFNSGAAAYVPNVYCKLKLVAEDAGAGAHHAIIHVVRLRDDSPGFRSNTRNFDNRDVQSLATRLNAKGQPIVRQVTAVHEIGHLLGLDHINYGTPSCPFGSNMGAPDCYGVTTSEMHNIMGAGMQLRAADAYGWHRTLWTMIQGETKIAGHASVHMNDWTPSLRHNPPRKVAVTAMS